MKKEIGKMPKKKDFLLFIENRSGQFKGLGFNKVYSGLTLTSAKNKAYESYDIYKFKVTLA